MSDMHSKFHILYRHRNIFAGHHRFLWKGSSYGKGSEGVSSKSHILLFVIETFCACRKENQLAPLTKYFSIGCLSFVLEVYSDHSWSYNEPS